MSALESAKFFQQSGLFRVYACMFPDYNWKQHSTGFLLGWFRETYYLSEWNVDLEDYELAKPVHEYIREELAKRPHLSNKRERAQNARKAFA